MRHLEAHTLSNLLRAHQIQLHMGLVLLDLLIFQEKPEIFVFVLNKKCSYLEILASKVNFLKAAMNPGQVVQLVGASSCTLKGWRFDLWLECVQEATG